MRSSGVGRQLEVRIFLQMGVEQCSEMTLRLGGQGLVGREGQQASAPWVTVTLQGPASWIPSDTTPMQVPWDHGKGRLTALGPAVLSPEDDSYMASVRVSGMQKPAL